MTTLTTAAARIPPGPAQPYETSEDLLEWMQRNFERYGDIYKARIYGSDVYVINDPAFAEHVLLRNWQNFLRKGQAVKRIALSLGSGLISSNGPLWVKQRRMIQPAFRREAVGALRDTFVKPNQALLERWLQAAQRGASVDVTADVSNTVLEVTLLAIFGADYGKVAEHFQIIAEESRNLEFAQTCKALTRIIVEIATERRAAGRDEDDILGMMMQSREREDGKPMADAQLAREALTLVIAGHETTASVLNWIWYLLARYPQVEARLVAEVQRLLGPDGPLFEQLPRFTYTRQVIEEALRSYPPLWLMTRKAIGADQLGEYAVPVGTEIYISPYLLQRHPRLWPEPERFDPERFGGEDPAQPRLAMCPFGAGPRNCIGEFFARVEMQIHVLLIAARLRLRNDHDRGAEVVAGVNLLSRHHFIMRPELHAAAPQPSA
jgi:cytochrome P450